MIGRVLERFGEWEHLGTKQAESGSRLIAHTPRDFPQAYLHRFFAPAPETAWQAYGVPPVAQLRALYSACNGLSLFVGSLSLWGLRAHYARDASAQFQPFDLATHHSECASYLPRLSDGQLHDAVFFGGYSEDGSAVMARPSTLEICRVLPDSGRIANRWTDLRTFLESEYDRLDRLFTREGYLVNVNASTLPESSS
jgi:hypothetical protein